MGEKHTIRAKKLQKTCDLGKLKKIRKENCLLYRDMLVADITEMAPEYGTLIEVNLKLWAIEDQSREKQFAKAFDEEFLSLACGVHFNNDTRAVVMQGIQIRFGSDLVEEKSYAP
jgi:hypothetical protein